MDCSRASIQFHNSRCVFLPSSEAAVEGLHISMPKPSSVQKNTTEWMGPSAQHPSLVAMGGPGRQPHGGVISSGATVPVAAKVPGVPSMASGPEDWVNALGLPSAVGYAKGACSDLAKSDNRSCCGRRVS
jgi:hypothetical protein